MGCLAVALLALAGCRTQLAIGQRGAVVERRAFAQDGTIAQGEPCCLDWTCGPRRERAYKRFRLELEAGPVWQSRNEVAIPGDTGTRFDLDDLTGAGPFPYGRLTFDWHVAPRHTVRAVVAPLELSGTDTLDQQVSFDGQLFAAGQRTKATYKFNSYRLTYRYLLGCGCDWSLHVGATAKIRDAKIELEQGGTSAKDTDLGFVPLLHVAFEKRLAPCWRFVADLDGAWAPQGRAFDFSAKLFYDIDDRWSIGLGYRTIEGGADNDTVYTFAWLHQTVLSAEFRF
ncbi:MAG: hypothetical protein QNJ98_00710 [Planctomycetota bacterium]|nr:hypothetical protein [Planctomycetota bacterium]